MKPDTLEQCQRIVLQALRTRQMSRYDIHQATGLRLSTVCARARELIDMGRIEPRGTKIDPITGRRVEVLRIRKAKEQAA